MTPIPVREPEQFDGNSDSFQAWLFSVDTFFTFHPIPSSDAKCLLILNLLTKGEAAKWAGLQQQLWMHHQQCPFTSWEQLRDQLIERFGKTFSQEKAQVEIASIKQQDRESPLVFNRRFRTLVETLGWDLDTDEMLIFYKRALHRSWIQEVFSALPLDPPATVSEWMITTERLYHNQLSRNLNVDGYGGRGHTPSVPYPIRNNQQPKPFIIMPRKDPEFNHLLPQVGQVRPAEGSGP